MAGKLSRSQTSCPYLVNEHAGTSYLVHIPCPNQGGVGENTNAKTMGFH